MTHWKIRLGSGILIAVAVVTYTPAAYAQRGQPNIAPPRLDPKFLASFHDAALEVSKSTVRVLCDDKEAALGTIVGPDGWIVTKYSLLSGTVKCKLKTGITLDAKVTGIHEPFDLAMLKVEATNLPAVKLFESKVAPVGNWIVSVGLDDIPVAVGVMSVATRTPPATPARGGRGNAPNGAQRGGGNRGGGNRGGGGAGTDFLGINVTPDGNSAKIGRVVPQSAGERAGLKVDDKILQIEGTAVANQDSLLALLGRFKPGDAVTIKLVRDGKEMEVKATLQAPAPQRGRADQNQMGSELSVKRTGFPTYFQTDTVIKPKDCGGPVCDLDGHVIGINLARVGRVESYAIASESLNPLLADMMSGKLSPRAVAMAALEKKVAELKASVKKAEDDKTAAEAKIKESQETLKKSETDKTTAEKALKEAKEALEKAEKEMKEKT